MNRPLSLLLKIYTECIDCLHKIDYICSRNKQAQRAKENTMTLIKTARNNLNKLVHVINEVRNTQVPFMHDTEDHKYRNMASSAVAAYLQKTVDDFENKKYTDRDMCAANLKMFSSIDVENTAGFHAQCLVQAMEESVNKVAWAHAKLGLFTTEEWQAAADFVSMTQLARDVCEEWFSKLNK